MSAVVEDSGVLAFQCLSRLYISDCIAKNDIKSTFKMFQRLQPPVVELAVL